jgi:uncharacterized protein
MTFDPGLLLALCAPLAGVLMESPTAKPANLAVAAAVSTSYVSGHETLTAVNDGAMPRSSRDTSHGAYGNWPRRGVQWVQYSWTKPVHINGVSVFWYDDARGVRVPKAVRLLQWAGKDWAEIKAADGGTLPLKKDTFNTLNFASVTTDKLRLELTGNGKSSTGMIEWIVSDAGNSPAFPPIVDGPADRTVRPGEKTELSARVRSAGSGDITIAWSRTSGGPGEVTFDNPQAASTTATFTAPGEYVLRVTARQGSESRSAEVRIKVHSAQPLVGQSDVLTRHYLLTSPFWKARTKALIVNWIPHCIAQVDKPDLKEGGIENLVEAGNKLAGRPWKPHHGYPFSNAWVLNTVEAMCVAQARDPDGDAEVYGAQAAFRKKLDEWIPIILAAQEPDGYFQTRITLGYERERSQDPVSRRWRPALRGEHQGYVSGYFIEAGIAHHIATGRKDARLYNAAKKLADCWAAHIGPPPKQEWYDGHEEMEQALFRLADYVDLVEGAGAGHKYAELGRFLLGCRGKHGGQNYDQTQAPVSRQYRVVGHAVRAAYLYSAMAAAARTSAVSAANPRQGDATYLSALDSLWDNLVNRKMYITGGIGSGETDEGFGHDYSLPNHAYCESCANAGMLFFQHQMNLLYGDSRYADISEDVLYNALLSDVDLAGQNFTYTNALDTSEGRYKWHVCPCCVSNIPRTLLGLPTWTYTRRADGLAVNLFIGGTTTVPDIVGTDVIVTQATNYPWDGKVALVLDPASPKEFALRIRVPSREASALYTPTPSVGGIEALSINDQATTPTIEQGYAVIKRAWKVGDRVEFTLPLAVQRVKADKAVAADRGRVALRYGPLLYNFESVDQSLDKRLDPSEKIHAHWMSDLLGGVIVLRGFFADGTPFQAVPNYTRNNRGGRSIVWVKE